MTLACFFHFSGLNNGITCMVVSSGEMEGGGFAPVAIGKVARGLNPMVWGKLLEGRVWAGWMSRSGRVIEAASQQAVESMLVESGLFQVWMNSCKSRGSGWGLGGWKVCEEVVEGRGVAEVRGSELSAGTRAVYLSHDYEESWLKEESWTGLKGKEGRGQWRGARRASETGAREEARILGMKRRVDLRERGGQGPGLERLIYSSGDEDPASGRGEGRADRESVPGDRG